MLDEIDPNIKNFLAKYVHSVAELELILLLRNNPERNWSAAEAASKLGLSPETTAVTLMEFQTAGLLTETRSPDLVYKYEPKTPDTSTCLDELQRLYRDRRVTLITLIYTQPLDKLRSFADAFRFRKEKGD